MTTDTTEKAFQNDIIAYLPIGKPNTVILYGLIVCGILVIDLQIISLQLNINLTG